MTSPDLIAPGEPYLARWRYRPDGKTLYTRGRPDWVPGIPSNPGGGNPGWRLRVSRATGLAYLEPTLDRSTLRPMVDMPTRANTGVPDRRLLAAGGPLTEVSSAVTYVGSNDPANPLVIADKWFTSKVSVSSGYVDLLRCQLNGDPATVGALLQTTNVNVKRVRAYDCDFWAQNPQWDTPAIKGHHTEVYRGYFRNVTDLYAHIGVSTANTNTGSYDGVRQGVWIQQSLIEPGAYISPDQGAAGQLPDNASHLDLLVQFRGGIGCGLIGNKVNAYYDPREGDGGKLSVDMAPNTDGTRGTHVTGDKYATDRPTLDATSAVMLSPYLGAIGELDIRGNWLAGGRVLINFAGHTSFDQSAAFGARIEDNRVTLGRDGFPQGGFILASSSLPATTSTVKGLNVSGNVRWDYDPWDRSNPLLPVFIPDLAGVVTTEPANARDRG